MTSCSIITHAFLSCYGCTRIEKSGFNSCTVKGHTRALGGEPGNEAKQ